MSQSGLPPVSSQGFEYGVKHFLAHEESFAQNLIEKVLNLNAESVEDLFQLGAVYINNQRWIEKDFRCMWGDHIRVHTKPRRYDVSWLWAERIVFQNNDFVVLNKPSGLPSHPSVDNQIENSLTQTEKALGQKLYISHRLDTLTEGLIIYGKSPVFVKEFNLQLQDQQMQKRYVALCETEKKLPAKVIHYMIKSPRAPKTLSAQHVPQSDYCELHILDQKILGSYSWVKIDLITGRTHQIRAQLADLGAPVYGDSMYGALSKRLVATPAHKKNEGIALRSQFIEFKFADQIYQFDLPEKFNDDELIER